MRENYGILLVDDEPAYHAIASALLARLEVRVDHAADRDEALRRAAERSYAMVLMDMQLGEDDGCSVAAALRLSAEWARDCPIIAFTSVHPAEGERYFRERGLDGWLAKPFEGRALVAEVRQRLSGTEKVAEPVGEGDRLAALLGSEGAASMISRLHENLAEAVSQIDAGADARPIGHRMGGLAGTLGFAALSAAWLSLQEDRSAWPTVRALTMEAIAHHDSSAGAMS